MPPLLPRPTLHFLTCPVLPRSSKEGQQSLSVEGEGKEERRDGSLSFSLTGVYTDDSFYLKLPESLL